MAQNLFLGPTAKLLYLHTRIHMGPFGGIYDDTRTRYRLYVRGWVLCVCSKLEKG